MSKSKLLLSLCLLSSFKEPASPQQDHNWLGVNTEGGSMRYSPLDQINCGNIEQLEVAWTYRTGELVGGDAKTIECTPLVVDGMMYITTAHLKLVALDAAGGKEIWTFDPFKHSPKSHALASGGVNRGAAFWSDGIAGGESRILHGTADGQLFSIDAKTGLPDSAFGDNGVVDLRKGIERDIEHLLYGPTSAPAIYEDIVILGFSNDESPPPGAPGDVRAFDVRSGREVWRFHTVPRPGEFGNDTWEGDSWKNRGGANAWGGISIDHKNGLAFFGTGAPAFDFYGGDRKGQNLFANCVVCLNAKTGERIWHFQTVHHDLWDYDLPSPPVLVDLFRDRTQVEAAAQVTKRGYLFLFDRLSGTPLFEVKDYPVPASDLMGEEAWPVQPIPVRPPPLCKVHFGEDDVTNISEEAHQYALERIRKLRSGSTLNPPSEQGTVVIPGFHGGSNWSGACFDPTNRRLYVNNSNLANIITMKKKGKGFPYKFKGYERFYDQEGYPAIKPPWGTLTAVDLSKGDIDWQVVLGEYPELTKKGVPQTGTENFGGPIVTAGGLVFIGGTKDEMFHAFDKETGDLLWQHKLPAGGYATPSTYSVDGKQFVVIAAGGAGKLRTKPGDSFVAFALPD